MNKSQLIDAVASKMEVSKVQAGKVIETVVGTILEGVQTDGEALVPGLGKLKVVEVGERTGTTLGKSWVSPAHKKVKLSLNKDGKGLV